MFMSGPAAEWRRPSSLQPLMFFTHTTMMMLAALVPSAAAAGNASDYVTVPGVYFPGSTTKAAGVVPSASSMVRVCKGHESTLPLCLMPVCTDTLAGIHGHSRRSAPRRSHAWNRRGEQRRPGAAGRSQRPSDVIDTAIEWALADPDKTSFVHMYRCSETTVGTFVKGPAGTTFKKCPMNAATDTWQLIATYELPSFVCEQSCDKNPACTAYAVDKSQQHCYIGGATSIVPAGNNYSMYIRLPGI